MYGGDWGGGGGGGGNRNGRGVGAEVRRVVRMYATANYIKVQDSTTQFVQVFTGRRERERQRG